ncbi:MAG: magnetochrome domain-containing protein, partial [Magnetococcales bacterium]|nr:magnetochrome domain-containing protein [Magnetococcales bacterium]
SGSDKFCGKEYHKYLYLIAVVAVGILIGGYWYNQFSPKPAAGERLGSPLAANGQPLASAPQNSPLSPPRPQGMTAAFPGNAQAPTDLLGTDPSLLNRPQGFAAVVKSLMPSVVNISAHNDAPPQAQVAGPQVGPELPQAAKAPTADGLQFANPFSGISQESIGSGIIVTAEGHVLTNFHVVENSKNIVVMVYNATGDKSYFADVVARDNTRDLALLTIEPSAPLKPAALGDSEKAQIGDSVITIGSPFGLNHSVSKGIVSGKRKVVNIGGVLHKGLIQTDAAINRGNSGGPLVDGQGWVIGINTAIYTTTSAFAGVGFAVPSNVAREFLEDWITLPLIRPDIPLSPAPGQAAGAHVAVRPPPPILAGAQPPHGDRGPCANCHDILPGPQAVAYTNVAAPAPPPIQANAQAPHGDRGPCGNCHEILPAGPQTVAFANVAATRTKKGPPIPADARLPHADWGPCSNCHQILSPAQPAAFGVGPGPGLHRPMPGRGPGLGGQGVGMGPGAADERNFDAMQQFTFSPGGAIGVTVAGTVDPTANGNTSASNGLGITWTTIDAANGAKLKVPVPYGVIVSSVDPGSSGQAMGLQAEDVILKADGRWLKSADQVQWVMDRLQRGEGVRLLIHRAGARVELNTAKVNVGGQPPPATWLPVARQNAMMTEPMAIRPQQPGSMQPELMPMQQQLPMASPQGG